MEITPGCCWGGTWSFNWCTGPSKGLIGAEAGADAQGVEDLLPLSNLLVDPSAPKVHIPPQQRSGVVYKIPRRACTKVYIGQTGQTLEHRLKEHRRALVLGEVGLSAVALHAVDEMHNIDWLGATVVDSHPQFRSIRGVPWRPGTFNPRTT